MKRACMAVAVLAMGFATVRAAEANVWWVDADNGVDATGRGTAADNAFQTLQYAHDAASAGDTIKVLPGNYNKGTKVDSGQAHKNRLVVSKKLYFISAGGKGAAHIVGAFDPNTGEDGDDAVRGICVTEDGLGSEFHGFVIRNCAAGTGGDIPGTGKSTGFGGDVLVYGGMPQELIATSDTYKAYFVDCVFSNNVAKWGAAMRGGTAIRCLMAGNTGMSFGQTACSAVLWNCVVRDNVSRASSADQRPVIGNGSIAVNTAFYSCEGNGAARFAKVYNCAFNLIAATVFRTYWSEIPAFNTYTSANGHFFVSPTTGDFRPVAGSAVAGGGMTSYLTEAVVLPADTEMTDYNGNPLDLESETCDAGPVQGAVATAGGCMLFNTQCGVEINGAYSRYGGYVYAESWPQVFKVRPLPNSGTFMRWNVGGKFVYPQYDGLNCFVPPADPQKAVTNTVVMAAQTLWTSPTANAAEADGSAARPFRTLQAAMDYVTDHPGLTIIYARPGEYAEGGAFACSFSNRVVFPANSAVLLKSTDGAAVITIRGQADPDGPYPVNYPGCGTNAMRCVATAVGSSSYSQAIQGFTLTDGHSSCTNNSYRNDLMCDQVGGIYGNRWNSTGFQALDCVFTNITAVRGGVFYLVHASRCVFDDCVSYGGVMRTAYLVSCEVRPTCKLGTGAPGASANTVLGTDTFAYFSTVPVSMAGLRNQGRNKAVYLGNLFGNQAINGAFYWGSVFKGATSTAAGAEGYAIADPFYADFDAYDYRIPACSPARYVATVPPRNSEAWSFYEEALVKMGAGAGIEGTPRAVANGVPAPGARQVFLEGAYAYVDDVSGALTVTGVGTMGELVAVAEGTDVTLASNRSAARPAIGCVVNGVTNIFADLEGQMLTVPYATIVANGLLAVPLFTQDWYVDAVNGSDANDGCYPSSPKKTLASVLAAATVPGDTVHAAPGDYNEGLMYHAEAEATSPASRAVVPPEVTLVADAGPDVTFITGASATADNADSFGRGTNAVRCAFLRIGAKLKGFTLRGGRTRCLPAGGIFNAYVERYDWLGGGVFSPGFATADYVQRTRVEDCVVSNCMALAGGAGVGATFDRCRLFKCRAQRGSAVERAGFVNSIADDMDSEGSAGIGVANWYCCVNATLGSSFRSASGNGHALYRQWELDYGVTNTVVLGSTHGITNAVNCVFRSNDSWVDLTQPGLINCRKLATAECALDADFHPDHATSALVDAGVETSVAGETDVYGGQRVYNGAIDIGAVEVDWRPRYRAILGAGGLTVTAADPQVAEDAGAVLIPGGSLSATWANARAPRSVHLVGMAQVTGNGTLTVKVDGETMWTLTAADGAVALRLRTTSSLTSWAFEYAPGESDTGGARLSGFSRQIGITMNFR